MSVEVTIEEPLVVGRTGFPVTPARKTG
jgi:hypothetical protein